MNKKFILPVAFAIVLGLALFVTANSQQGTQDQITFEVRLNEGWNLVASGAFASYPEQDSEIKSSDLGAIFYYSPLQKKYLQVYPAPTTQRERDAYSEVFDKEETLESNFQMESRAYWVYSNKAGVLKFMTDDVLPFNQRQLRSGWNFVSITSEMLDKNLGDFKGSCEIEKISYWDKDYKKWEVLSPEIMREKMPAEASLDWYELLLFEVYQLGEGVLFKVPSDCQLGTSGNSNINPPQIPQ